MQWRLRCLGFLVYQVNITAVLPEVEGQTKLSVLRYPDPKPLLVFPGHWLSCILFCGNAELIDPCRSQTVGFTIVFPSAWCGLLQSVCLNKSDFFWKTTFNLLWEGFRLPLLPTWKLILSLTGLSEPASTVCSQSPFRKLEAKPSSSYIPLAQYHDCLIPEVFWSMPLGLKYWVVHCSHEGNGQIRSYIEPRVGIQID